MDSAAHTLLESIVDHDLRSRLTSLDLTSEDAEALSFNLALLAGRARKRAVAISRRTGGVRER